MSLRTVYRRGFWWGAWCGFMLGLGVANLIWQLFR